VSRETMRKWMMAAKLWQPRKRKVKQIHVMRPRRSRLENWCSGTAAITIGWKSEGHGCT
jgi:hypothetical protein